MANSIGKKSANTGVSKVPRPKPENKVSPEPRKEIRQMIKYSTAVKNYSIVFSSATKSVNAFLASPKNIEHFGS
jgi:hypothetical protein